MSETKYTKDHEYVRLEGHVATVGITDYAQSQLGDVVYVGLPEIGKVVMLGGEAAVVESVKAASDVFAPMSGEVVEINSELEGSPSIVNEDPLGKGWFLKIKIRNAEEFVKLMSEAEYQDYLKTLG
jgi:glycine cleavage system H protein